MFEQKGLIRMTTIKDFLSRKQGALKNPDIPSYVLEHKDETLSSFEKKTGKDLEHYGVLGMKWGRRKNRDRKRISARGETTIRDNSPIRTRVRPGQADMGAKNHNDLAAATNKVRQAFLNGPARNRALKILRSSNEKYKLRDQSVDQLSDRKYDQMVNSLERKLTTLANKYTPLDLKSIVKLDDNDMILWVGTKDAIYHAEDSQKIHLTLIFDEQGFVSGFSESIEHGVSSFLSYYGSESPEDVIKHYGVLGMRWGYRKRRNGPGKFRTGPKAGESGNARDRNVKRKTKPTSSRSSSELSSFELQNRIKRIKLEQEYAKLTAPEKTRTRKFVEDVVVTSANKAAKKVLTEALVTAGEAARKKAMARIIANAAKTVV